MSDLGSDAVDGLESKLAKYGSRSITTAEPTAYIKPVEDVIIQNPSLQLRDHLGSIPVCPDCERQQLYSCAANGGLYNEADIKILAMVLNGADITEVFSPERVTRFCSKYGFVAGDLFELRDGYDFFDPKTQAMVVKRVMNTEFSLVIGSPPCTMFSRIQQLNLHIQGSLGG